MAEVPSLSLNFQCNIKGSVTSKAESRIQIHFMLHCLKTVLKRGIPLTETSAFEKFMLMLNVYRYSMLTERNSHSNRSIRFWKIKSLCTCQETDNKLIRLNIYVHNCKKKKTTKKPPKKQTIRYNIIRKMNM